jgi:hypothetical protein
MTYEPVSFIQAVRAKYARMTFERKSMSTKTSIKRIALVAVSALGLGVVTSVAPASAAVLYGVATLDTPTVNYAGRVNNQISITVRGDVSSKSAPGSGSDYNGISIAAAMTDQPSGSSQHPDLDVIGTLFDANLDQVTGGSAGTSAAPTVITYAGDANSDAIASGTDKDLAIVKFTPTHVGTYKLTVWNEQSSTVALSGAESYQVFTINVTSGISSITVAAVGGSGTSVVAADDTPDGDFADFGEYGSLLKVSLLDGNGNPAALAAGEVVSIDPSGTGDVAIVNNSAQTSTAGAAYSLTASDFTNGVAWVNITDTVAEVVTVVATSGTVVGTTTIEFKTTDNAATFVVAPKALTTGWKTTTAGSSPITTPRVSSITYAVPATATLLATEYAPVRVYDELGKITGNTAGAYDLAIAGDGSFTITATAAADSNFYDISDSAGDADDAKASLALTVTAAPRAISTSTITLTPSSATVAVGGSIDLVALIKDQYGVAYGSGRVTASIAGRNAAQSSQTSTTNSSGKVSFKITDTAATASPLTSDTVTITAFDEASSGAATATITWSSKTVKTVTLTAEDEDSTVAGTVTTDIAAAYTGATGAYSTVTATVKDANGSLMAGVPVVFAVTGLTGAEVHTTKVTVYTGTNGVATSYISSYAAGKATVTATAGGVTDTDYVYFKQQTPGEARTIASTVTGRVITSVVKDRYGNPVADVSLKAVIAGNGFFGTGTNVATGTTDKNGEVKFLVLEGNGDITVETTFSSSTYGQTTDAAGKVGTGTAATAVTASTAGDALTDQKGLGGSLAPAGVNSVSVSVAADGSLTDALDAANEATDAANAATDAANAAAEAADAATAAAQDAQAAVAELATKVASLMAGIKAQITSLTNLVIKIQKKVKA